MALTRLVWLASTRFRELFLEADEVQNRLSKGVWTVGWPAAALTGSDSPHALPQQKPQRDSMAFKPARVGLLSQEFWGPLRPGEPFGKASRDV